MRDCRGCGSPLAGDPLANSWACPYCKLTNYNEGVIGQRIKDIDFSKAHSLLEVGITAYEAGDYDKALAVLETVLSQDSSSGDAWIYSALCVAYTANLTNFEKSIKQVHLHLRKAEMLGANGDLLTVSRSVCANALGETAIRAIERQLRDARKAYESYESTNTERAVAMANEELDTGIGYATQAFALQPDDPHISGQLATLSILSCRYYKRASPYGDLVEQAERVLSQIKETNAKLYGEFAAIIAPPKESAKSGCATQMKCFMVVGIIVVIGWATLAVCAFLFLDP